MQHIDQSQVLQLATRVLVEEAAAITKLAAQFQQSEFADHFLKALYYLHHCQSHIIVSGLGKSGHIARKLAATFSSMGMPAFFLHPTEACHGDLGAVTAKSVLVALSFSGTTTELLNIVPQVKMIGSPCIAITGNPQSRLAKIVDVHLHLPIQSEACLLNLAPTASTTATLAIGDALAITLSSLRGLSVQDFARFHPGGFLGKKLMRVRDLMRCGQQIPFVPLQACVVDAVIEMTKKCMGMTVIVDDALHPRGIFTDGDLRRLVQKIPNFHREKLLAHSRCDPYIIQAECLASEALKMMQTHKISQLPVVDHQHTLVGALSMHDVLAANISYTPST